MTSRLDDRLGQGCKTMLPPNKLSLASLLTKNKMWRFLSIFPPLGSFAEYSSMFDIPGLHLRTTSVTRIHWGGCRSTSISTFITSRTSYLTNHSFTLLLIVVDPSSFPCQHASYLTTFFLDQVVLSFLIVSTFAVELVPITNPEHIYGPRSVVRRDESSSSELDLLNVETFYWAAAGM
jgi:hypothetical protein